MALVVLLRGVNVGGHRTFRPKQLAEELKHLDVVNIGAAGTFVVRKRVTRTDLRAELGRRLPFDAEVILCDGREIMDLTARNLFSGRPARKEIVRFVSVLARKPRKKPSTPINFPDRGRWQLQILTREDRFVVGRYRRQMRAIGYFSTIDKLFGVPATTRNWNTISAIAKVLAV